MSRPGRTSSALLCLAVLAALALALAGCGHKEESTPVACLEGPEAYLTALGAAPGEVLLGGETTIGDCLTENQDAGDLSQVGEAMVEAATALNAEARGPGGVQRATELGYLVGSVERRAEETGGVHAVLVRRLAVASRFAPDKRPLSQTFRAAYAKGFAAAAKG
jgi:hypothetical protein